LAAGVAALGVAVGFPGAMQGQQRPEEPTTQEVLAPSEVLTGASVRLRVDGRVCPFCAYSDPNEGRSGTDRRGSHGCGEEIWILPERD